MPRQQSRQDRQERGKEIRDRPKQPQAAVESDKDADDHGMDDDYRLLEKKTVWDDLRAEHDLHA